jgi:AcrR family transcriptional regulator
MTVRSKLPVGNKTNTLARPRLGAGARRAMIVEAAGQLFGEHGYDATTLEEIAAAAGVTKPILYRHFDSKQDLYLALLRRHRDDLPTFAEVAPASAPPADRVRAVLDFWLDYVESHVYAWRMLFRDRGGGAEIDAFRREVQDRARGVLAGLIGELSAGAIPRRERLPLAELMRMGMASLVLWWVETPGVSREAVLDAMTRAWLGLLATTTTPSLGSIERE